LEEKIEKRLKEIEERLEKIKQSIDVIESLLCLNIGMVIGLLVATWTLR